MKIFKPLFEKLGNTLASIFLAISATVIIGVVGAIYIIFHYGKDLPDHSQLANYSPETITRLYSSDGMILAEYAKEKRLYVPISAIPKRLRNAFIAAEDKNFYNHPGVDFVSVFRALMTNIANMGSNRSLVGGSTITQQVVKNFLLTNERSLERKVKEAILAFRITQAFPKNRILELYLNEIYLGNRSYGVAAAALNYFDKSLNELSIEEAAMLAALPKAPSTLDPKRNPERAKRRRDWVIKRMAEEGYINEVEALLAATKPINLKENEGTKLVNAGFFTDTIKQKLSSLYGRNSVYEDGLSVHTTLDSNYQIYAEQALFEGLRDYDRRHGWRGPITNINEISDKNENNKEVIDIDNITESKIEQKTWLQLLKESTQNISFGKWQASTVLSVSKDKVEIGLIDGSKGNITLNNLKWARKHINVDSLGKKITSCDQVLSVGDVIAVSGGPESYKLEQIPKANGAIVAMDPHTGKVLAMVGGFNYEQSQFNRAVQAARQPGSAFKPFVYLAALENGFSPNSIIVDEEIQLEQGEDLPNWRPQNHSGEYYGPTTLRVGVEKSRNAMTVRLANNIGINKVMEVGKRFGIYKNPPRNFSTALGASETTLLELTNAYSMLVNGGKKVYPSLIERIQNRDGKNIYRWDRRECEECIIPYEDSNDISLINPPQLTEYRDQISDPIATYQSVSILEGAVERGTGKSLKSLKKVLAGKTGTTNDSYDAWFMGFSADLAVGVYAGFDNPKTLGKNEYGSSVALPIWKSFMKKALAEKPNIPFRRPAEVKLVKIDATTGKLPTPGTPRRNIILEAFREGTEPTAASALRQKNNEDNENSSIGNDNIGAEGIY